MDTKYLPWNPEWLIGVYIRIGSVIWQGQCVEDALAKFIALAFEVQGKEARGLAIDVLTKNKKLTLGALIVKLREHADLPDAIDADLTTFRDDRNWVVHHSYKTVLENLRINSRLAATIERIEATDLLGHRLTLMFWDVLKRLSTEFESGSEFPSETAKKIREQWNR